MCEKSEFVVLNLTKTEKEYIERCAAEKHLSIEQFLILCAISLDNMTSEKLLYNIN